MRPETTIVIAAYNEEHRLPETLARVVAYLSETGEEAEIVVVDDGSTDNTAKVVREAAEKAGCLRLISYPRNRGKGYALRTGVHSARGALILVTDADLSTPIEELETLRSRLLRAHDIAIGSRALPESEIEEAQPTWRRAMSYLFKRLVKSLVIDDFHDTQCGFKLFRSEAAKVLFAKARIDRFAYDVEVLALAREHGYRVVEVPVRWKNSSGSKVRPVADSLQMLVDLVRIRLAGATIEQDTEAIPTEGLDTDG